jgi:transcriptional regulator with PAS, ATPase and Fis domain
MLDELGDLPAALQHKLLRLLDEQGAYQVLGESKTRYADLRIVGATNCELSDLEHDLVPRLTLRIIVPPLRERLEDIPLLVRYIILAKAKKSPGLVERFVRRDGPRPEIAIEAAFMTALLRHIYDGNVRELTQILWRAILTAGPGDTLVWSDMLDADKDDDEEALEGGSGGDEMPVEETRALLERHEWVITRAARAKRISRHALQRLVAKYGLKRPAK